MTDHELLKLSAKAVGIDVYESTDGSIQNRPIWVYSSGGGMGTMPYEESWNPLIDNHTAFEIAVKLKLTITPLEKCVFVETNPEMFLWQPQYSAFEMYKESVNPYDATRRAIVRAAAEIAKSKEA